MFRHMSLRGFENEGKTSFPSTASASFPTCSIFTSLVFYPFCLSCFTSFHQSQSLDQVALTNATILDGGGGGGPNGSLAGSMGSVAVCLPSESSLTDSLHTSSVSSREDMTRLSDQ